MKKKGLSAVLLVLVIAVATSAVATAQPTLTCNATVDVNNLTIVFHPEDPMPWTANGDFYNMTINITDGTNVVDCDGKVLLQLNTSMAWLNNGSGKWTKSAIITVTGGVSQTFSIAAFNNKTYGSVTANLTAEAEANNGSSSAPVFNYTVLTFNAPSQLAWITGDYRKAVGGLLYESEVGGVWITVLRQPGNVPLYYYLDTTNDAGYTARVPLGNYSVEGKAYTYKAASNTIEVNEPDKTFTADLVFESDRKPTHICIAYEDCSEVSWNQCDNLRDVEFNLANGEEENADMLYVCVWDQYGGLIDAWVNVTITSPGDLNDHNPASNPDNTVDLYELIHADDGVGYVWVTALGASSNTMTSFIETANIFVYLDDPEYGTDRSINDTAQKVYVQKGTSRIMGQVYWVDPETEDDPLNKVKGPATGAIVWAAYPGMNQTLEFAMENFPWMVDVVDEHGVYVLDGIAGGMWASIEWEEYDEPFEEYVEVCYDTYSDTEPVEIPSTGWCYLNTSTSTYWCCYNTSYYHQFTNMPWSGYDDVWGDPITVIIYVSYTPYNGINDTPGAPLLYYQDEGPIDIARGSDQWNLRTNAYIASAEYEYVPEGETQNHDIKLEHPVPVDYNITIWNDRYYLKFEDSATVFVKLTMWPESDPTQVSPAAGRTVTISIVSGPADCYLDNGTVQAKTVTAVTNESGIATVQFVSGDTAGDVLIVASYDTDTEDQGVIEAYDHKYIKHVGPISFDVTDITGQQLDWLAKEGRIIAALWVDNSTDTANYSVFDPNDWLVRADVLKGDNGFATTTEYNATLLETPPFDTRDIFEFVHSSNYYVTPEFGLPVQPYNARYVAKDGHSSFDDVFVMFTPGYGCYRYYYVEAIAIAPWVDDISQLNSSTVVTGFAMVCKHPGTDTADVYLNVPDEWFDWAKQQEQGQQQEQTVTIKDQIIDAIMDYLNNPTPDKKQQILDLILQYLQSL